MTVLRRIMALPVKPVEPVRELGIDDFAWKRGRKWGTILVDMQSHKVIDILPDRSAETAAAWIAARPEIEPISRDRGGDYASAAKTAAPQAIQCADRFHVLKTLARLWRAFWPATSLLIAEAKQKHPRPSLSLMCKGNNRRDIIDLIQRQPS